MKIFLCCLSAFLAASYFSAAQGPHRMADTAKTWSNLRCLTRHFTNVCCCQTITNRIAGDTAINDVHYQKVYESRDSLLQAWTVAGFLKEDTQTRKVYFRNLSGDEGLIYDFGLMTMESVQISNTYMRFPCPAELTCYLNDSVLINGAYRARYLLGIPSGPHNYLNRDTWIEGIGSIHGIFSSGYLATGFSGAFSHLRCYAEHDEIIYRNPDGGACYNNDFYPVIVAEPTDTAFLDTWYELIIHIADTSANNSANWYGWSLPGGLYDLNKTDTLFSICDSSGNFPGMLNEINCGYTLDIMKSHPFYLFPTFVKNKFFPEGSSTGPYVSKGKLTLRLTPSHTICQYEDGTGLKQVENGLTDPRIVLDVNSRPGLNYFVKIYVTDSEEISILY